MTTKFDKWEDLDAEMRKAAYLTAFAPRYKDLSDYDDYDRVLSLEHDQVSCTPINANGGRYGKAGIVVTRGKTRFSFQWNESCWKIWDFERPNLEEVTPDQARLLIMEACEDH